MTTPTVFPPVRGEPFFELIPGFDVTQLRMSVRWQSYLDQLGSNSNESDNNLEYEISGIESEIQQVQSFTAELAKRDDELDALISSNSKLEAKVSELTKKLDCLSQLVE